MHAPSKITVRLPILLKDLAQAMKKKASELISKLFMQGLPLTINDYLDDETTVQLIGQEFNCEITIDAREEEKSQLAEHSIADEIKNTAPENLSGRPPVVTFMGHVDHGKTTLVDNIRKSNTVASEHGSITQHIGAFTVAINDKKLTILDTPGHEDFTIMRQRGANVTDIVVLVIAGNEGVKEQTIESINSARNDKVPIIVAINKKDKTGFNLDKVYKELTEHKLVPEAWGGDIITATCSALHGEGVEELLEMVLLQAELLDIKAHYETRARGTVLESQLHSGLGALTTILVQNGTLHLSDFIVMDDIFGRIKSIFNEQNANIASVTPGTVAKITGPSGSPAAGSEFIVVKSEKEAKKLATARKSQLLRRKPSTKKIQSGLDTWLAKKQQSLQEVLPIIIRTDVLGSLEALKIALGKIKSEKIRLEIVTEGIGCISESDVELAHASQAVVIGFHTKIESHTEDLAKQKKGKSIC